MAPRVYDAVVIGAGHNGLCLAAYLQRAGLRTAVVERRHEEGGGVNTEEPLLPGFRFNLHAQYMEFFDIMPMIQDFKLDEIGLRTVMPEAQAGIAFADGRPPVILHRPDLLDRTHQSISRYSKDDADRYVELKTRAAQLETLLAIGIYNPPSPTAETALTRRSPTVTKVPLASLKFSEMRPSKARPAFGLASSTNRAASPSR